MSWTCSGRADIDVVPVSRSGGVDVITGDGLAAALKGAEVIIDAASGSVPDQQAATEFFTTEAGICTRPASRPA